MTSVLGRSLILICVQVKEEINQSICDNRIIITDEIGSETSRVMGINAARIA